MKGWHYAGSKYTKNMKTKPEIHDNSATMSVHNVGILCVNGGRFAEISYGICGQMSVMLNESDAVASLFASADAEFDHARIAMRRAMRIRNAAWKLSVERTNAA